MALHEQSVGATDEWYTPPYIFQALGCTFDADVAAGSVSHNWVPARNFILKDSLSKPWEGFIWMNPPFGPRNGIAPWLKKFVDHGDGIALTPDRTSAPWWQDFVVKADLVLFVSPKIKFIGENQIAGKSPAQGTTLMAIGERGCAALKRASTLGVLLTVQRSGE